MRLLCREAHSLVRPTGSSAPKKAGSRGLRINGGSHGPQTRTSSLSSALITFPVAKRARRPRKGMLKVVASRHRVAWVNGLAHWTQDGTAYLSIAFTWRLNEARMLASRYRSLG